MESYVVQSTDFISRFRCGTLVAWEAFTLLVFVAAIALALGAPLYWMLESWATNMGYFEGNAPRPID